MKKRNALMMIALFILLVPLAAFAEDGYNAQRFQPSIFGGNFIAIEDANTLCPLGFGGGLILNYANRPLEFRLDEEFDSGILNQLVTADALVAFGPFSWASIGVDVPVHLYSRGRSLEEEVDEAEATGLASETTLGDIRAEIKFRILQQEKHWLGMALAPYGTFPTGDETIFLGEGRTTFGGNLILERDLKIFNLGLNGGYHFRGDGEIAGVNLGDAWRAGAGVSRDFGPLSLSIESFGAWLSSGSEEKIRGNPIEALGTLRYKFGSNGPRLIGGGGGGITGGIGSPAYRLLAGIDYYHCAPKPVEGTLEVEVIDENSAPLAANLSITGIKSFNTMTGDNGLWASMTDPGLYSVQGSKPGYHSAQGEATVVDGETAKVQLQLKKMPTVLKIVVLAKHNNKPLDATAVFTTGKKLDIPGGTFTSDWEAGSFKMEVTSEGYETKAVAFDVELGTEKVVQVLLRKKIKKIGKVYFDFDSDVIRQKSYSVLNDVVAQLNEMGDYNLVIIEGHCSSEGTDEYNMNLSTRRAKSVMNYLANKGIDPAKMRIEPFGESRPIASNDVEEGREQNRRVEFIIE